MDGSWRACSFLGLRSALSLALVGALGAGWAAGCSGRPPVPLFDAGPRDRVDGAAPEDDADTPPITGRPDGGPRLPPVDDVIVLPYFGDAVDRDLEVEGEVGALDVFFSIDTTGSFGEEIDNLQAQLRSTVLPQLRARVSDVAMGVGRFEDFPFAPFGSEGDRPFRLMTAITTNDARVASAVAGLDQPLGHGGDIPESGAEALYQIATGEGVGDGLVAPFSGRAAPGGGTVGGVGFRQGTLRVLVHVTDAPSHDAGDYFGLAPDAHDLGEAIAALSGLAVRTIGISSGEVARAHLETVARGTGATIAAVGDRCATGIDGAPRPASGGTCALVFDVRPDGSGLSGTIVDAITDLLDSVQYAEVWGESDDALGFVRHVEAVDSTPPAGAPPTEIADRRPAGDGIDDTFLRVRPGTRLRLRAHLRNETIAPADYDQLFHLTIRVLGDGVVLTSLRLRIVVPRGRLDAGPSTLDAGAPPSDAGAGFDAAITDAAITDAGAGSADASADAP